MARPKLFLSFMLTTLARLSAAQTGHGQATFDRAGYVSKLHGFWLGQSIANWTGLITEMDRVEPPFYTDDDWGSVDQPSIWGSYVAHSSHIEFYLPDLDRVWGADDDTDIEYMYWQLVSESHRPRLKPEQIRAAWLKHIYSNEDAPLSAYEFRRENYLWVSNENAYYLMKDRGQLPPATTDPQENPDCSMIDAQLTTESFGLMAPGRPDVALRLSRLPIAVTASGEAAAIARFYVVMHALAVDAHPTGNIGDQLQESPPRLRKSFQCRVMPMICTNSCAKNIWGIMTRTTGNKPATRCMTVTRQKVRQDTGISGLLTRASILLRVRLACLTARATLSARCGLPHWRAGRVIIPRPRGAVYLGSCLVKTGFSKPLDGISQRRIGFIVHAGGSGITPQELQVRALFH